MCFCLLFLVAVLHCIRVHSAVQCCAIMLQCCCSGVVAVMFQLCCSAVQSIRWSQFSDTSDPYVFLLVSFSFPRLVLLSE